MKRGVLLRHLQRNGCELKREGKAHSIWRNPQTNEQQPIPRHREVKNQLAAEICKNLSIPPIGG